MTYNKFYHRVSKDPQDMDIDELNEEMEGCEEWEEECIRIGQGINSKETSRERKVKAELNNRYTKVTQGDKELSIGKYGDMTVEDLFKKWEKKLS